MNIRKTGSHLVNQPGGINGHVFITGDLIILEETTITGNVICGALTIDAPLTVMGNLAVMGNVDMNADFTVKGTQSIIAKTLWLNTMTVPELAPQNWVHRALPPETLRADYIARYEFLNTEDCYTRFVELVNENADQFDRDNMNATDLYILDSLIDNDCPAWARDIIVTCKTTPTIYRQGVVT